MRATRSCGPLCPPQPRRLGRWGFFIATTVAASKSPRPTPSGSPMVWQYDAKGVADPRLGQHLLRPSGTATVFLAFAGIDRCIFCLLRPTY